MIYFIIQSSSFFFFIKFRSIFYYPTSPVTCPPSGQLQPNDAPGLARGAAPVISQ